MRNLKVLNGGKETNVYTNSDRTILKLEAFRIVRKEVKLKQAIADQNDLNVKYVIKNNKIVESTRQPFRFNSQELWN